MNKIMSLKEVPSEYRRGIKPVRINTQKGLYDLSIRERNFLADVLIPMAIQARKHSYAPYSKFRVGAALMSSNGEIYLGANIENDIYRATHAERFALDAAVFAGAREFYAIAVVGDSPAPVYPCGQCLQDLSEFDNDNNGDLIIIPANMRGKKHIATLAELLPVRFTPSALGIDPRKY
jgi:cytidine deaminase